MMHSSSRTYHARPGGSSKGSERSPIRGSQHSKAVSRAALRCAFSELMEGEQPTRQKAREFLAQHKGQLDALSFDVLRGLVSQHSSPLAVKRVLRELKNHPAAIERAAPVLVHLMRHADSQVAFTVGRLLGAAKGVRDVVVIPVLAMAVSSSARHQHAARAFESVLRGEEIFDVEVHRAPLSGFLSKAIEQQAEILYQQRMSTWYASDKGRSLVLGALCCGSPHLQRIALETLLAVDPFNLNYQTRLTLETAVAFNVVTIVSEGSSRLVRDLFMKVASRFEYSPELAGVFLESARTTPPSAQYGDISAEIAAKLYYGAASLLRGECTHEAIDGVGKFLCINDHRVLARIARRLVSLSAELPESSGEHAVTLLFDALRGRTRQEGAELECKVLLRAIREVSGYDTVVVDGCGRILASGDGVEVERAVAAVLHGRPMFDADAIQKASAMLSYIEGQRPAWHGLSDKSQQS